MTKAIIIDIGSEFTKVGITGVHGINAPQEEPIIFPSVIGYQKYQEVLIDAGGGRKAYDILAGDQATSLRGVLKLLYPIKRGRIVDFASYLFLLSYAFSKLGTSPNDADTAVFIVDRGAINREHIANVLFNEWGANAVYFMNSAILNLWGCGRFTGVGLEIGAGLTAVTPIFNGYVIPHALEFMPIGGGDIVDLLSRLLTARGWRTTSGAQREIIRTLFEKACYVPRSPTEQTMEFDYVLPDGESLIIADERKAPELLFNPSLSGKEIFPIDQLLLASVKRCDTTIRRDLWKDIVLAGGTSQLPGLKERLHDHLTSVLPEGLDINIVTPSRRAFLAWYGAGVLASRKFFHKHWITPQMFQQNPQIVNSSF